MHPVISIAQEQNGRIIRHGNDALDTVSTIAKVVIYFCVTDHISHTAITSESGLITEVVCDVAPVQTPAITNSVK